MGFSEVKKALKELDKNQIIELIGELYKKNNAVKEYFEIYTNPGDDKLLTRYREKVYYSLYPKRGNTFNLKEGKQALNDFKKLGPPAEQLAELMLFYVETGVSFTNDFGDINEAFYTSLESAFVEALNLMHVEDILEKYKKRAFKVVNDTGDIGWGFHDYLAEVFWNFYPEE